VEQIFADRAVRTVLLFPENFTLPEAETPVLVDLRLTTQFGQPRQQFIFNKTLDLLKPLKFQEAVGYDTRNHQRIVGWLPVGGPDALFQDSFQVEKAAPILRIEVFADTEPAKEPAAADAVPADKPHVAKISPDLRRAIAGQADAQKPI